MQQFPILQLYVLIKNNWTQHLTSNHKFAYKYLNSVINNAVRNKRIQEFLPVVSFTGNVVSENDSQFLGMSQRHHLIYYQIWRKIRGVEEGQTQIEVIQELAQTAISWASNNFFSVESVDRHPNQKQPAAKTTSESLFLPISAPRNSKSTARDMV